MTSLCIVSTLVVYTLCMHGYGRLLGIVYCSLFQYVLRRSFSRSFWLLWNPLDYRSYENTVEYHNI